jgi:hypothetical protein
VLTAKGNPDAWIKHALYLNVLKNPAVRPDEDEELEVGITYGFKFAASPRRTIAECDCRTSRAAVPQRC